MSLKRTNVYADPEDLALIKEIAARRGVPEAEIIREGIHLAAMSNRVWDDSFDWPTFEGSGETATSGQVTDAVARGAAAQ
jgi:Ribbon-helix-helix protein, copG family